MGIDQARNQQTVGGVDPLRVSRDALARRQHSHDGVPVDQEIGGRAIEPARGQQPAPVNELLQALVSTGNTVAFSMRRIEATPASMRNP
jgi:hypothetical protein